MPTASLHVNTIVKDSLKSTHVLDSNCRIHHMTVSIATRILITNLGQINFVSFKMQVMFVESL